MRRLLLATLENLTGTHLVPQKERDAFHTRIDVPTEVQLHYGACQPNRPCVRLYDSFRGLDNTYAWTRGWYDSAGNITGWVAITFNNSYLAEGSVYENDFGRIVCHEGGHAIGLIYHRYTTTARSCMVTQVAAPSVPDSLNGDDIGYANSIY